MAGSLVFGLTPAERVAIDMIREERPEILDALRERLTPVVDELTRTCRGLVTTERETENLLDRLRAEFVRRMMAEIEPWGEDEELREAVTELVARDILAQAKDAFVQRVIQTKRN